MRVRKVINEKLEGDDGSSVHAAGAVNAIASANVNESAPSRSRVSSRRRVVQRDGKTFVSTETSEMDLDAEPGHDEKGENHDRRDEA